MIRCGIDNIYVTKIITTMTYKPKFYWDPETLEAFKFDAKHQSYSDVKDDVEFFVYSDCTPEDGETYEDLIEDLLNQIFAEYDKEIN